ncbi:MAG: hypothetical protein R2820_14555 [Cyclobacteriaceae bacterium]|nr:hypothetical protein [Cyclobacteriaceae bacterium]
MIKNQLLNYRTTSALKGNQSLRASIPYRQALTVGILFSVEDKPKHDAIKEFIKQLQLDGKKVSVLEYLPKQKDNYEFLFDFFTIKDLSFWGKINSPYAEKFIATPFDYLFCVDRESNPLIQNLLARSKAKCRIGKFSKSDHAYYELMIEQQNGSVKNLIDSMYKYAKQLR